METVTYELRRLHASPALHCHLRELIRELCSHRQQHLLVFLTVFPTFSSLMSRALWFPNPTSFLIKTKRVVMLQMQETKVEETLV